MSEVLEGDDRVIDSVSVEVGSLVIVNCFDRPCERLIAVVTECDGENFVAKYLNTDKHLDRFNVGIRGQINEREPTPIGWFGVKVHIDTEGRYRCFEIGDSRATYSNGDARYWQGQHSFSGYVARKTLVNLVK